MMQLPSQPRSPSLTPERAHVLLFGPPKVGKSTLAASVDPERTLFLACEPGLGALSVIEQPIRSWAEFRDVGAELAKGKHGFSTIVIDTVDELHRFCSDHVLTQLGVTHPSDAAYGKGWAAIQDEFRLRVGKLASLGFGVWFISHSVERDIETRVGKITKTVPSVPGKAREFIGGFVDFILLATSQLADDGERRVLRTAATENFEAGGRVTLTDPLPLDAGALRADLARACETLTAKPKAVAA